MLHSTTTSAAAAAAGLLALTSTTLFSSVSAQYPSSSTACTRHYTVEQGDTCDRIGQQTLTSTYQIMANNLPQSGPDCFNLQVGAQLCLGHYGSDCQMVHRAIEGDTCESIASAYGISVKTLRQNNPSMDCDEVYDGLMLCTVSGLVRPPAPKHLKLHSAAPVVNTVMPLGTEIKAVHLNATADDNSSKAKHFKQHVASHHKINHHH